ncbi:MAG: prepilin-type N-terminal cleavage/methylation domain-containing protein [Candidatus Omnitrophica bacterium]|nr:prepilin-type N-terminal cleavage/methylation domain-containing protein [Candidatus Omnitrophota bacterium]
MFLLYDKRYPLYAKRGFTLIEVLVAISIFAVIAAAIIAVFIKGIEVWENSHIRTNYREEALLFLEGMEKELKNNITLVDSGFKIEAQDLYFTTLKEAIYNIRYKYDKENKMVYRYTARYPKPVSIEEPIAALKNVKTLNFTVEEEGINLPAAIKIYLTISDEGLQNEYSFLRVIDMPVIR